MNIPLDDARPALRNQLNRLQGFVEVEVLWRHILTSLLGSPGTKDGIDPVAALRKARALLDSLVQDIAEEFGEEPLSAADRAVLREIAVLWDTVRTALRWQIAIWRGLRERAKNERVSDICDAVLSKMQSDLARVEKLWREGEALAVDEDDELDEDDALDEFEDYLRYHNSIEHEDEEGDDDDGQDGDDDNDQT
jgi:hypothetical protein